ncbi:MAG: hypothetical protein PHS86_06680 [Syntrophaceae bacterium]|nr:hypothetical protein [Syntrophaceae bacterium]
MSTLKPALRNKRSMGLLAGLACLALLVTVTIYQIVVSAPILALAAEEASSISGKAGTSASALSNEQMENRLNKIEQTLYSIKVTGEKAEDRSYFNKMISVEVIRYLRLMVIMLVVIAIVFPLAIWILGRKRMLNFSGSSVELAETLVQVEERQAKLAHILKEIQSEVDYLHTMSTPDLQNLIKQAENYLKLSQQELDKTSKKKP